MAITKEQLAEAFKPAADLKKAKEEVKVATPIDLGKVASSLIDEMAVLSGEQEDPDAAVAKLEGHIKGIEKMLDGATESEDGAVSVMAKADDESLKPFLVDETAKADDESEGESEEQDDAEETSKTADEETGEEEEESDNAKTDDEVEKGLDAEEGWPDDMSPAKGPVRRAERLTKAERPLKGGRRGRGLKDKYDRARSRAMGRGEGRCMS